LPRVAWPVQALCLRPQQLYRKITVQHRENTMTVPTSNRAARLDPWCLVPVISGEQILFGFATEHPGTGGLAWTRSSAANHLISRIGLAWTESGRVYTLGRRFEVAGLQQEGDEAVVAYALLIGQRDAGGTHIYEGDPTVDAAWLKACKATRHLGIATPGRKPEAVAAFLSIHGARYWATRSRVSHDLHHPPRPLFPVRQPPVLLEA
jgi:hypothetical protein